MNRLLAIGAVNGALAKLNPHNGRSNVSTVMTDPSFEKSPSVPWASKKMFDAFARTLESISPVDWLYRVIFPEASSVTMLFSNAWMLSIFPIATF